MGACFSSEQADAGAPAPAAPKHDAKATQPAAAAAAAAEPAPAAAAATAAAVPSTAQHALPQQPASSVPSSVAAERTATGSSELSEYAGADAPLCELARRQHLLDLNILHTEPEARFDDITSLCSLVFKVPIALVSLVDENVQWFKSAVGLPGVTSTPRNQSFCAWTLLPAHPEALVVEDALEDARFSSNPLVTQAPFIRFYAGCPLVANNGMRLGSLCLIDKVPRQFDAESCNMLANMAEMVVREIERDKMREQLAARRQRNADEQRQLLRTIDAFSDAIMLVDVSQPRCWSILFANEAWEALVARRRNNGTPLPFWDVFQLPLPPTGPDGSGGAMHDAFDAATREQQNFELLLRKASSPPGPRRVGSFRSTLAGTRGLLVAAFRCAATSELDPHMPRIGVPSFLPNAEQPHSYYFATLRAVAGDAGGGNAGGGAAAAAAEPLLGSGSQHGGGAGGAKGGGTGAAPSANGGTPAPLANGGGGSQLAARLGSLAAPKTPLSIMHCDEPFADVRLGPLLGRGAFGKVFRGTWRNAVVAVKVLEYTTGQDDNRMLEGLLSERLSHPHVVRTYKHMTRELEMEGGADDIDSAQHGGYSPGGGSGGGPDGVAGHGILAVPPGAFVDDSASGPLPSAQGPPRKPRVLETWLVLEFCNRGSLSDAVEKGLFQLPGKRGPHLAAILATAREVAAAMSYLHHHNVLHGDLTGNNVLLTTSLSDPRGFTAKVSDFGMSRLLTVEQPVIETRTYGTVTHMAPELLMQGTMSRACDVYSLGIVLWEIVAGCRPHRGLTHAQVLHAVSTGRRLEPPALVPPALAHLISACTDADPARRPAIAAVLEQLQQLEKELPAAGGSRHG